MVSDTGLTALSRHRYESVYQSSGRGLLNCPRQTYRILVIYIACLLKQTHDFVDSELCALAVKSLFPCLRHHYRRHQ